MQVFDVHAVLYAADGMEPYRTPFLSSSSVIGPRVVGLVSTLGSMGMAGVF